MGKEPQSIRPEDFFQKQVLPFMIMIGISHTAMVIFMGLALTSQLDLFKWLTWLFAAMLAVVGYVVVVRVMQYNRLRRKKQEQEQERQTTM